MNSAPGVADGVFELYIDDVLEFQKLDIPWMYPNATLRGWNTFQVGGNTNNIWVDESEFAEQWYAVDDVIVSTTPIDPNYIIGEPAKEPVIHFSDILSGSKSGNTDGAGGLQSNEHGAIVTIWGNNLGFMEGDSKVYFNDSTGMIHEVAYIYYWKNSDGSLPGGPSDLYTYHKMQEVAFSINSSVSDGLGEIFVEVNGKYSNSLNFTVQDGNIFFVKQTGSDSTGDGSWLNPWRTAYNVGQQTDNIYAGDIVYFLNISETNGIRVGVSSLDFFKSNKTHPISLVTYPGSFTNISGYSQADITIYNFYGKNEYLNFAKLFIHSNGIGIYGFKGMRVIGCELTGPLADGTGGVIAGAGDGAGGGRYFGNYIHDFGNINTSSFHHVFYLSNRDGTINEAYEFGWNYLIDNLALHAFHIYDQSDCGRCAELDAELSEQTGSEL